ncbi:MAG: hypothetical protein ABI663_21230 [Chryseolinea sp.]
MDKDIDKIKLIREQTIAALSPDLLNHDTTETFISPSKHFIAKVTDYLGDIRSSQLEIINADTRQQIQLLYTNDSCFHSWVIKNGIEYLICAEDLCGGQTVVDLSNNKVSSYTLGKPDGFIWTDHHLSPKEDLLAVVGCGWGSPNFVVVYKFDKPMDLPLQKIYELDWTGQGVDIFIEWVDNDSFKLQFMDKTVKTIKMNLEA